MVRASASRSGGRGFEPRRVIPKTFKMVPTAFLSDARHSRMENKEVETRVANSGLTPYCSFHCIQQTCGLGAALYAPCFAREGDFFSDPCTNIHTFTLTCTHKNIGTQIWFTGQHNFYLYMKSNQFWNKIHDKVYKDFSNIFRWRSLDSKFDDNGQTLSIPRDNNHNVLIGIQITCRMIDWTLIWGRTLSSHHK